MSDLLVIIPSRGRPESVEQVAEEFFKNSTAGADLLFATDDDQPLYPFVEGVKYRVGPRLRLNGTLNAAARECAPKYKYIGFMGDDHRTRTYGWDEQVIEALETHNVVYGNDLLQGENLATAVFLRSEIITKLGYMAPPALIHLYLDNFWMELGRATSIKYLPNVIIEHLHPAAGKAEWTEQYTAVNSEEMFNHDEAEFKKYMAVHFQDDLEILRG